MKGKDNVSLKMPTSSSNTSVLTSRRKPSTPNPMDSASSGGTDKACALWVLRRWWKKQAAALLRAGQRDGWVRWGDCPDVSEPQFSLYDKNGVYLRGLWRELNETRGKALKILPTHYKCSASVTG